MSDTYHVIFKSKLGDKHYNFHKKITVKQMLTDFLQNTDSIVTFDPKKVRFFYNGILLSKKYEQNIENIFGKPKNVRIEVKDLGNIIGGSINIQNYKKPLKL